MSLYGLSALVLIMGVVLTALVFLSYRKRLADINAQAELTDGSLQHTFTSTALERGLGYGLVGLIAYLIWQTITQGFDFALLLIGATAFTGFVYLIDYRLTRKARLDILARATVQIPEFEANTDTATLEPGLIENSRAFFPILVFVFLLRSFLVEPFQIPSGSMKPTLEISDFILVNRFIYGIRMPISNKVVIPIGRPQQGDVIVFKPPHEPDKNFIKRVIGVPGDLIQYDYSRRVLRVNGEVVTKDLVEKRTVEGKRYSLYTENLLGREHQI
ncbi:signal peptidase I, partial [Reinekea sp.]|uniref:signal peptidase I n=1 Tax=Reinekea sp. TaxID=1970455 RepID=UPI002A7EDF28